MRAMVGREWVYEMTCVYIAVRSRGLGTMMMILHDRSRKMEVMLCY